MTDRYNSVIAAFTAIHRQDPNTSMLLDGELVPDEWLYIQRLNKRMKIFVPNASEELCLAANCQHLRRWEIERSDYSDGRLGYFKWRSFLAKYQSGIASEILIGAGYSEETAERIRSLNAKENLHQDIDSQSLEDVVCLVFMEFYLEGFAVSNPQLEFEPIIVKTLNKMSKPAIQEALKIKFPVVIQHILSKILS